MKPMIQAMAYTNIASSRSRMPSPILLAMLIGVWNVMLVKRTTRPTVTMVRMRTVHLLRKVYLKPEVLVVISMLLAVENDQNAAIVHHCLSAWEGRGPARAHDRLCPRGGLYLPVFSAFVCQR